MREENVVHLEDGTFGRMYSRHPNNHNLLNCRVCKLRNLTACALSPHTLSNAHQKRASSYSAQNPMSMETYNDYNGINNVGNPSFLDIHPHCLFGNDKIVEITREGRSCFMCYACEDRHIPEETIINHLKTPQHVLKYTVKKLNSIKLTKY